VKLESAILTCTCSGRTRREDSSLAPGGWKEEGRRTQLLSGGCLAGRGSFSGAKSQGIRNKRNSIATVRISQSVISRPILHLPFPNHLLFSSCIFNHVVYESVRGAGCLAAACGAGGWVGKQLLVSAERHSNMVGVRPLRSHVIFYFLLNIGNYSFSCCC
jgi:hypothetical protein